MDGLEATKIIRHRWHQDQRIIIVTSLNNYCEICLVAGADDFLTKPLGIENFRETIKCIMPIASFMSSKVEGITVASDPCRTE